jgi:hypothetical protein
MSEPAPQSPEKVPANLTALRAHLNELATTIKCGSSGKDRQMDAQGPVLVVRGK